MLKSERDEQIANSYEIKEFDPMNLLDRFGVMSIVAMTGSGKTVFIVDCLSQVHKHFKHVFLISKTAKLQKCYDFIDRSMIKDDFDEEFLIKLWDERVSRQLSGQELEPMLLIFDDVLNDKKVRRSKIMNDIFTASRFLMVSCWCLSHSFTVLSPLQRNNTCWFVSFDLDSIKEREKLAGQYLSADNQNVGMILFRKIVKETKYQCIVIENHKASVPLTEKVKKYIANPNPKPFKIKNTYKPDTFENLAINKVRRPQ